MVNFWSQLKKPVLILAPMADVTDAAFRALIAKYSRPDGPDVFYTEFVSADGLCHPEAREKLKRELYFSTAERPMVAQIFSGRPERIYEAAALVAELGFDGLDINMGCPDRAVEKQMAGACLIKDPALATDIIAAAKAAAPNLPVAVKTRIGYTSAEELPAWAETLLAAEPAAITFHLRTRREMSQVPARWDLIKTPVALAKGTGILIFGNGDVNSVAEARIKADRYGVDGVMIGRGIFGRPWLFADQSPPVSERLQICLEHTKLFEQYYRPGRINDELFAGHTKSFQTMKKHFKAYVSDFPAAGVLRAELMATENADEVEQIINKFLITRPF